MLPRGSRALRSGRRRSSQRSSGPRPPFTNRASGAVTLRADLRPPDVSWSFAQPPRELRGGFVSAKLDWLPPRCARPRSLPRWLGKERERCSLAARRCAPVLRRGGVLAGFSALFDLEQGGRMSWRSSPVLVWSSTTTFTHFHVASDARQRTDFDSDHGHQNERAGGVCDCHSGIAAFPARRFLPAASVDREKISRAEDGGEREAAYFIDFEPAQ